MVFKDIYEEFVAAKLQPKRQNWDNLSDDVFYVDPETAHDKSQLKHAKQTGLTSVEKAAYKSFLDCRKMCDEIKDCFQFSYHDGICAYHKSFLLGKPRKPEDKKNQGWTSGWAVDKIHSWVQEHSECKEPVWPKV
ncbi:Uu.00g077080.m01.CDS01 [Anthostomella pinea]|uniref:Uu.00g077080.m01.CDS01 n=1 Tax=Anthostomella pinea TaxID=933095 RepID=A0AAI8VW11_9PEZI|nr:Uu.00g077080.m01.CDS01 [Anthostomella pinea]